jgi:3-oxoacyl-[acyl-carrier protein] reductase
MIFHESGGAQCSNSPDLLFEEDQAADFGARRQPVGPGVAKGLRMHGKVVVVTGGASGIGRGAARLFGREGARVVIADIDRRAGEATTLELTDAGTNAVFVETDVTLESSCVGCISAALARFGRVDVLLSNAGVYPLIALEKLREDDWERTFAVNVKGAFFMVRSVLPSMRARGSGRIVLTSSVIGPITGNIGTTHYAASKAALLGFMRSAAVEVARDGVTINAVLPGHILTEGSQATMSTREMDQAMGAIPANRLGTPADVAHAMLYLASDEAGYVTGQTITVDGGLVLPTYPSDAGSSPMVTAAATS